RPFRKSTTCDIPDSSVLKLHDSRLSTSKCYQDSQTPSLSPKNVVSMNRIRSQTRRFSLVKIDPPDDEIKINKRSADQVPSSPNLIQKLLFRQFNPKTRPYSMAVTEEEDS
ncbi:unnamed protein product, partial [Didymodactylos carnosus]